MEGFRWMRGARGLGAALVFLGFGAALLAYPAQVQRGLAQSVLYCLASLVPSLFPFMVLASFGVRSGAGEVLGKLLGPVTRRLFRLPRACGATVLLSFLGGYPAGARGVSLLLEQGKITREQAGRMLCFCVAPGAAFVVTFVGWGLLGSLRLGSSATLKMCGCILLFAGILAVLQGSGLFQRMAHALAATGWLLPSQATVCLAFLLEVTGGMGAAAQLGVGPLFYAFGLAFGGLCVHMQVFAFFPEFPLAKGKFFLARLLHGLGAAGMYLLLERLFPGPSQPVWAAAGSALEYGLTASTAAGGLSLLLMCLAFLVALQQRR